jgi:hypothetical protein
MTMPKKRKPTTDAVEILHRPYSEGKPDMLAALEEARANDEVARKIYELRTKAGLNQRQLAKLVGTTASVKPARTASWMNCASSFERWMVMARLPFFCPSTAEYSTQAEGDGTHFYGLPSPRAAWRRIAALPAIPCRYHLLRATARNCRIIQSPAH